MCCIECVQTWIQTSWILTQLEHLYRAKKLHQWYISLCIKRPILPYGGSSSGPFQEPETSTYYAENLQPIWAVTTCDNDDHMCTDKIHTK